MKKPESPPPPGGPPPQAAPSSPPTEELPIIVSFAMRKKGTKWAALALETQGLKVLRIKVLEMDTMKDHVRLTLDRAQYEMFSYGNSPFAPEVPPRDPTPEPAVKA